MFVAETKRQPTVKKNNNKIKPKCKGHCEFINYCIE